MPSKLAFPYTTFSDSFGNPVANGTAVLELTEDACSETGQICGGMVATVALDQNGTMTSVPDVYPNYLLSPLGTSYLLSVYSSAGEPVYGPESITITSEVFTTTVLGTAMPWLPTLGGNASLPFGNGPSGAANGTDPTVITCSPGQTVNLLSSGLCNASSGAPYYGPNGGPYGSLIFPTDPRLGTFPMAYVPGATASGPLTVVGLLGAFADINGAVVLPVSIGATASVTAPAGSASLQLGINTAFFSDNGGSFDVSYTLS